MKHISCLAHALDKVCDAINNSYKFVDKFNSVIKSVLLKLSFVEKIDVKDKTANVAKLRNLVKNKEFAEIKHFCRHLHDFFAIFSTKNALNRHIFLH